MDRAPLLIGQPLVEFWLIPTIYVLSGPNRKPTRTLFRCRRFPGDPTTPLDGQGNHALPAPFTSTGRTALSMTALRLSSCGVFYAFPPVRVSGKLQTL